MKKVELLAPAGNFECLKAAVNNGADAVYLGGSLFSARAFADNFNNEEIVEAIRYAHLRNVKIYVTLNTLLSETELENAYQQAKFLYENKVDALIIQDLGLFYRLRQDFKDFELHASTQMHIHNKEGVKAAKKLGFQRVVLARESSLSLIQECTKEDIEIECFVHGAICVSYSGQCLLSAFYKSRSANKGMCAQCCRLKYKLSDDQNTIQTDTDYLLSPKDMFLIKDIPSLIEAGVTSFKIEGRLKSPAYVAYTTKMYRKAIDAYYANQKFELSEEEFNNLKALFNRGFTNTYLHPEETNNLFNNARPNHMGLKIGEIIKTYGSSSYIKLEKEVHQFDGIRVLNNSNDSGLILNMMKIKGLFVNKASKGDIIEIEFKDKVKVGDVVVKTQDSVLEKECLNGSSKEIPLSLHINVYPQKPLIIDAYFNQEVFHYQSNILFDIAQKRPLTKENIIDCFNKKDDHPYLLEMIDIDIEDCFMSLKVLNDLRREFYDQLDEYRYQNFKRTIYPDFQLKEIQISNEINPLIEGISSDLHFEELVNPNNRYEKENRVVKEMGGLFKEGGIIAYHSFNVMNSYAYELLLRLGFKNVILSLEINDDQTKLLLDAFHKRAAQEAHPYVFAYGNRILMNLRRNPVEQYSINDKNLYLNDGNNRLFVNKKEEFVELIDTNTYIRENKPVIGTIPYLKVKNTDDYNKALTSLKWLKIG